MLESQNFGDQVNALRILKLVIEPRDTTHQRPGVFNLVGVVQEYEASGLFDMKKLLVHAICEDTSMFFKHLGPTETHNIMLLVRFF